MLCQPMRQKTFLMKFMVLLYHKPVEKQAVFTPHADLQRTPSQLDEFDSGPRRDDTARLEAWYLE
jgi:hypothetical protein